MGWFDNVLDIVKQVIPVIPSVVTTLVPLLMDGHDGHNYTQLANGQGVQIQGMDEPISEKEIKQEEVLVATRQDITKRQLIEFAQNQARTETMAFQMPLAGLSKSKVVLTLHLEFTFGPQPTDLKVRNVNFNDHIYLHLMPSKFAFYNNLLKHEIVKFNKVRVVSANTSGFDTSTILGFIPVTTDTRKISNGLLMQLCKKLEISTGEEVAYNIRYASPDLVKYEEDDEKNITKVSSKTMYLEPNKSIKTDYLKLLDNETALSYGTIVIIKQNVGTVVGMSFNVNMEFDVWDYIVNGVKLVDVEDKDLDGDTEDDKDDGEGENDGSGESAKPPSTSQRRIGRRQQK